jgi:YgiT-type zinc finger domain-containing protein
MDPLLRIKRLVVRGFVRFTEKARLELEADGLEPEDALEAILSAPGIQKVLRSRSPRRAATRETLYVIVGTSFSGFPVYTKGVIRKEGGQDVLYILVSEEEHSMKRGLATCPTCGRRSVQPVIRTVTTHVSGRAVQVPGVALEECSSCGERLYDLAALHQLAAARTQRRRPHVA